VSRPTIPPTYDVPFPLTDPRLAQPRVEPRSAVELCNEAHARHMLMAHQDDWLRRVLASADQRRADDEALLRREIADGTLTPAKPKRPKRGRP
jgi:hypothetical protein